MSLLPNVCVKGWREAELPRESLPSFLSRKRLLFVRSLFPAGDGQAQVIQLLVVRPAKPVLRGPRDLQYSGKVNLPCAKVLAYGQNACTRRKARPMCHGAPSWPTKNAYSSSEVSSRRVTARDKSSSCLSSTKSGQLVMGSLAFCTLGKAMTSRMDSAPAISMHRRSRP